MLFKAIKVFLLILYKLLQVTGTIKIGQKKQVLESDLLYLVVN